MEILHVKDLMVYYGEIHALKGVSLRVNHGDIITLIGSNGAGKSTLLNALTGVVSSVSGEVLFREEDIFNQAAHRIVKAGISHVPEGRKIFSELTIEENLRAGAYVIDNKHKIAELLETAYELFPRLAERKRQVGGSLSGGEQQMLAIARGLMSDPELLLLDEPSLGLAPILVDRIFDFIVEVNKMGKSILLVEQNANIALHVASYGYVLETGTIATEGQTEQLLKSDDIKRAYLGIA